MAPPPLECLNEKHFGSPSISTIQSAIKFSNSVAVGLIYQAKLGLLNDELIISPITAAWVDSLGKYAKKLGWCHNVILLKSIKIS